MVCLCGWFCGRFGTWCPKRAIAGPDVRADGVVLTIPMPGHAFGGGCGGGETEAVRSDVERLHCLIDECDVVFLLADTRESRWLPTVMALATETPMINAALGLDSWLVMRHGPSLSCLTSLTANKDDNNGGTVPPQEAGMLFLRRRRCARELHPRSHPRSAVHSHQARISPNSSEHGDGAHGGNVPPSVGQLCSRPRAPKE
jgi:hypothetical protein